MINKETHKRFWVTLSNAEYEVLALKARDLNLSVTAYARQIISDFISEGEISVKDVADVTRTPAILSELIMVALEERETDSTFTVKDLFSEDVWQNMNRSEKAIAAKILASIERTSNEIVLDGIYNKTSIYRKVEQMDVAAVMEGMFPNNTAETNKVE